MTHNYPKGAIKNLNELNANIGKLVIEVSRIHSKGKISPHSIFQVISTGYKSEHDYAYFEAVYTDGFISKHSNLDRHIPWQDYNDWFLFTNYTDALAYLNEEGK